MYPDRELRQLAAYKAALRRDIAFHRGRCTSAAARVAQPLEWLDRALAFWRQFSPLAQFAALPLGFFVWRTVSPRLKILRTLVRWYPPVLSALRIVGHVLRARPSRSSNGRTP